MKDPIDTHKLTDDQGKMIVGALQLAAAHLAQQMASPEITAQQIGKAAVMLQDNKTLQVMISAPIIEREKEAAEKAAANAAKGPLANPPVKQNRAARRGKR